MITNEFFQGYYQALDTIEQGVEHLMKQYQTIVSINKDNTFESSIEALQLVREHIHQVRTNYKTLQRQLADGQKKK